MTAAQIASAMFRPGRSPRHACRAHSAPATGARKKAGGELLPGEARPVGEERARLEDPLQPVARIRHVAAAAADFTRPAENVADSPREARDDGARERSEGGGGREEEEGAAAEIPPVELAAARADERIDQDAPRREPAEEEGLKEPRRKRTSAARETFRARTRSRRRSRRPAARGREGWAGERSVACGPPRGRARGRRSLPSRSRPARRGPPRASAIPAAASRAGDPARPSSDGSRERRNRTRARVPKNDSATCWSVCPYWLQRMCAGHTATKRARSAPPSGPKMPQPSAPARPIVTAARTGGTQAAVRSIVSGGAADP